MSASRAEVRSFLLTSRVPIEIVGVPKHPAVGIGIVGALDLCGNLIRSKDFAVERVVAKGLQPGAKLFRVGVRAHNAAVEG